MKPEDLPKFFRRIGDPAPSGSTLRGFLFDITEEEEGVGLWIRTPDLRMIFLRDPAFRPSVLLEGAGSAVRSVTGRLSRMAPFLSRRKEPWKDLFTGEEHEMTALVFSRTRDFRDFLARLPSLARLPVRFFNADIDVPMRYLCQNRIHPLSFVQIEKEGDTVRRIVPVPDQTFPEESLESGEIRLDGRRIVLFDGCEERTCFDTGFALLRHLAEWIRERRIDVLYSHGGDRRIFPRLLAELSHRFLPDSAPFSGKPFFLSGRWHLDRSTSFFLKESSLSGLIEIARFSFVDFQTLARCTAGGAISSAQIAYALQNGIRIPYKKEKTEGFSSGADLVRKDRGGLVMTPRSGVYENMTEMDFSSLYPALMVHRNISPETVNCPCCQDNPVPGSPHHLCRKRRGIIPAVLEPILKRRLALKRECMELPSGKERDWARKRQTALKWILVVCFGYLGYKNARFGNVESHEAVTAWGRASLLAAKDILESRNLPVRHAIVDSLWFEGISAREADGKRMLSAVRSAIIERTGIAIETEGLYSWIVFLPQQGSSMLGSANRYFGRMSDGRMKFRGIAARQRKAPPYIRKIQEELMAGLSPCPSADDVRAALPGLLESVRTRLLELGERQVPLSELLLSERLHRLPETYDRASPAVVAAQKEGTAFSAKGSGAVSYWIAGRKAPYAGDRVIPAEGGEVPMVDLEDYRILACGAAMEILGPFCSDPEAVRRELLAPAPAKVGFRTKSRRSGRIFPAWT